MLSRWKNRRIFKGVMVSIVACILTLIPAMSHALPQGGNVTGGSASISTPDASTMNITQTTNRAIINWQGFSIDVNELVKFIQPGSSAVALNRVVGVDPSSILGQLVANGRIFLVNPNGIVFGPNSTVDAAGLLATTLNINDNDFMSDNYSFFQDQDKALSYIINQGKIVINDNGFAVLVAPLVSNEGLIIANLGQVKIGAAEQFTVNFDGEGLVNFVISNSSGQTPGTVLIPTSQITDIIKEVVNTSQIIEAGQVVEEDGVVKLVGASGTLINTGTIQADGADGQNAGSIELNSTQATLVGPESVISVNGIGENSSGGEIKILSDMQNGLSLVATGAVLEAKGGEISGDGGFIEVSAHDFYLPDGVVINASAVNGMGGTFLLDPTDITIQDAAGSMDPGAGGIFTPTGNTDTVSDDAIEAFLNAGTSVILDTTSAFAGPGGGDITQNADAQINKTAGVNATITLDADDAITLNGGIVSTVGTLGVTLTAVGAVDINAAITTNGGNFNSSGTTFDNTTGAITTGGGGLTINHSGAVTIGAVLNTGAGNVDIDATGASTIALNNTIDTTTGNVTIDSGGVTTVAASGNITTTTGTVTFGGTLAGTLTTSGDITTTTGGNVTFTRAVTLGGPVIVNAGNQTITTSSTVAAGANALTLTADEIELSGAANSITGNGDITLQPSTQAQNIDIAGAGGTAALDLTAAEIGTLTNGFNSITIGRSNGTGDVTIAAITFNDPVIIRVPNASGDITVNGQITGAGNASVTLDGGSATTTLNANIVTAGNAINITDNVEIDAATVTLNTANGVAAGNNISISGTTNSIAAETNSLTLNAGTGGAITLTGAVGTTRALDTLTITNSGGATFSNAVSAATVAITDTTDAATVAFQGNLTATTALTVANVGADLYNVSITGTTNSIAGTTTFANGGTVTIGNGAGDSTTFTAGVAATAPSTLNIAGTIAATTGASTISLGDGDTAVAVTASANIGGAATGLIDMGDATLADGVLLTVGTGIGNAINLDAVTGTGGGAVSNLTINTTGVVAVAEAVGTDIGTVTITNSGGTTFTGTVSAATVAITDSTDATTVSFADNMTVTTGMTVAANGAYNVSITGGTNSIAGDTNFLNTGLTTIGNGAGDSSTFTGGLGAVSSGGVSIAGTVATTDTAMDLGALTLTGNSTLDTNAATNAGDLTIGAVTGGGFDLTLDTGHVAGADISGTSVSNVGTLTIRDVGTATFTSTIGATTVTLTDGLTLIDLQGAITATTLNLPATVDANVNMTGNGNTITNAFAPANLGNLTLGQAGGTQTYIGGLNTSGVVGTVTINGTINTTNTALTLGAVTLGSDTTFNAGTNTLTLNGIITGAANALTLTGDEIDIIAAINGTGAITLQPSTASLNIIIAGGSGTGALELTAAELDNIANGHSLITIGNASGTGAITIAAYTFHDPATIQSPLPSGTITVNGTLGDDNGSGTLTLDASPTTITLNANIITTTVAINLADNVELGTQDILLDTTNGGTAAAANVTITGTVNSVAAQSRGLTIDADDALGKADVSIGGAIGATTALNFLTINGNDISVADIGAGAAGVTNATAITAATDGGDTGVLTFTGTTYNANQQTYTAEAGNNILLNGGATTTFTSSNDSITFATADILLANGSNLVVNSVGGAISIQDIQGTSSEDVTLDATGGTIDVTIIGGTPADGIETVALTADGGITLRGNITTANTATNTVTITGPVTLASAVTIDTDNAANDGKIDFSGATSTINGGFDLSLQAGTADIDVDGVIGGTTAVASLNFDGATITIADIGDADTVGVSGATDINGTTDVIFAGTTYKANQQTYTSAAGNHLQMNGGATTFTSSNDSISFNTADILLANGSDLVVNSTGGAITILDIQGTSDEDVTLNAAAGTIDVTIIGGTPADGINTVALTGAGGITLRGNITTSDLAGNTVTITGPVTLGANITIDTDTATNDGNITFVGAASTINADFDLTLTSGGGNIDVNGTVGGGASLNSFFATGNDIEVEAITTNGTQGANGNGILLRETGAGDITFNGALTATGGNIAISTDTTLAITQDMIANGDVQIGVNATFANADITDSPTTINHSAGNIYTTGLSSDDVIIVCTTYNQSGGGLGGSIGTAGNPVADSIYLDPVDIDIGGAGMDAVGDIIADATNNITISANVSADRDIILRSDSDNTGVGDIIHYTGTVTADADNNNVGGILMAGVNITLDDSTDAGIGGGLVANGVVANASVPPGGVADDSVSIALLAATNVVINENITADGNLVISADADQTFLTNWPAPASGVAGPAPDGTGDVTISSGLANTYGFASNIEIRSNGAAPGAISIQGINTTTSDAGGFTVLLDADGTVDRSNDGDNYHSLAAFVMYAADNLTVSSGTTIDTLGAGATGNVLLTNDYAFDNVNNRDDLGITSKADDAIGTFAMNGTINSGGGIELTGVDMTVGNLTTTQWIDVESTAGYLTISGDWSADANRGTTNLAIRAQAETDLTINAGSSLSAGTSGDENIGLGANDADAAPGTGNDIVINGNVGTIDAQDVIRAFNVYIGDETAEPDIDRPNNITQSGGVVFASGNVGVECDDLFSQTGTASIGTATYPIGGTVNIDPDDIQITGVGIFSVSDITLTAESPNVGEGILIDGVDVISQDGSVYLEADNNGDANGRFLLQNDARIVADADASGAPGILTIHGQTVTLNSQTTDVSGLELDSGGAMTVTSDEGISIGTATTVSTDLNSDTSIQLTANGGSVLQNDGTIVAGGLVDINATDAFTQNAAAGGGVNADAIQGAAVDIDTTNDITMGSNAGAGNNAAEATAGSLTLTSAAGQVLHTGDADLESTGGNVDIDAATNVTLSGAGDIIANGDNDVLINAGTSVSQTNAGADIQAGDEVQIGVLANGVATPAIDINGVGITAVDDIIIRSTSTLREGDSARIQTTTAVGNIELTATGALTVENNAIINSAGTAGTSLDISGSSVTLNSQSGIATEIIAAGATDIDATAGNVSIGTAGTVDTDLDIEGATTIDAHGGDVLQNDGTIDIAASLDIGLDGNNTVNITQGANADAIRATDISLRATTNISLDSPSAGASGSIQLESTTGGIDIYAVNGDVTQNATNNTGLIQSATFLTIRAGGVDGDINLDPAIAGTFIDLMADDTITIDGDVTATNSHIYIRADADGSGAGDVNITGNGTKIFADDQDNDGDGVIWILGDNVTIGTLGATGGLEAHGSDTNGDVVPNREFAIAILAQDDVSYDGEIKATEGSIYIYADAPVSNLAGHSHRTAIGSHLALAATNGIAADGNGSITNAGNGSLVAQGTLSDIVLNSPEALSIDNTTEAGHSVLIYTASSITVNAGTAVGALNGHVILWADSANDSDGTAFVGDTAGDGVLTMQDNSTIVANIASPTEGYVYLYGRSLTVDNVQAYGQDTNGIGILITANDRSANNALNISVIGDLDSNFPSADIFFDMIDGGTATFGDITQGSGTQWTSAGTIHFDDTTPGQLNDLTFQGDVATAEAMSATAYYNTGATDAGVIAMTGIGTFTIGGNLSFTSTGTNGSITQSAGSVVTNTGNITYNAISINLSGGTTEANSGYIDMTATTGNLTANALTADTNGTTHGAAIELSAPSGTVTVGGAVTTDSNAPGNTCHLWIDPVDVLISAPINVTGHVTAFATNNITVNANISTTGTGSEIWLRADDAGTNEATRGAASGANGQGNLTMAAGTSLSTASGAIKLSGENVTLYNVTAGGSALTIESDLSDTVAGAGDVTVNGTLRGASVSIDANNGAVYINADPNNLLGTFTVSQADETLFLNADLRAAGAIVITPAITICADSTISGDLTGAGGAVTLSGAVNSNVAGTNNLTISTGAGAVSVQAIGTTIALNSVTIATTGITTLNGSITANNGIDLSGATNVDLGGDVTLTTIAGDIRVNGGDVDGAFGLALTSTSGNLYIDDLGQSAGTLRSLTASTGGTAYLSGNITTNAAGTGIDMKGVGTIELDSNVTMTSNGQKIDLGSADSTSITESGARTLTLVAGAGAITLDDVDITTLAITSGGSNTLYGNITVDNPVNFSNAGTTTLARNVKVTTSNDAVTFGAVNADAATPAVAEGLEIQAGNALITLGAVGQGGANTPVGYLTTNSGTVALNGAITAANNGNISITTTDLAGDIAVNNNINTSGTGKIDLTAGRDINVGTTADATITAVNGDVTLTGVAVTIGGAGTDFDGNITTATGTGNVKIDASGSVTIADTNADTSGINSGGYINIDPTNVTINGAGLESDEYITITATGTVTNNTTIQTTDNNSYITIDAGSIAQNGDITTPVAGGSEYVTLNAVTTITDTTSNATDITTNTLNITGATSVGASGANNELDTDVATLNISNVTGDTYILENNGLTVNSVVTTGAIDIDAGTGGMAVGSISGGAITLAADGAITDNNGGLVNVTGTSLTIDDAASIDLDTQVGSLSLSNVDGAANISNTGTLNIAAASVGMAGTMDIATSGDLTVGAAVTTSGAGDNITLTSTTGSVIVNNAITADSAGGAATIRLNAGIDIRLAADVNATASTVTLDADGAITDDGNGDTEINAVTLNIVDATTVGTSMVALDANVTTLQMSGVSGASYILEENAVDLNTINVDGSVDVRTSAGDITATSVTTSNDDVTLTSAGNITITSVNAGDATVTLNAAATGSITDTAGAAGITAGTLAITRAQTVGTGTGSDPALTTNIDTLNMSNVSGASYIIEGNGITLGNVNVGGLVNVEATLGDITAASVVTSDDAVTLTSQAGAINVGLINAGNNTVTLDAAGAITDSNGVDNNITAATLNITDALRVAIVGDPLDTTVSNLSLSNVDGDTYLINTGALTITDASTNIGGSLDMVSTGTMTVAGNVTVGGANTVDLTSTKGDINVGTTADATITAVDGDVTLTGADITLGDGAGNDGNITTAAGSGNVKIDASGAVAVNTGSSITAGGHTDIDPTTVDNSGTINANDYVVITASGAVTNTGTISTNNNNSYITIDAGSIAQNGDITTPVAGGSEYVTLKAATTITDTTDNATDITTNTLNITGATSIGDSAADAELDTDVATLNVSNVSGASYIKEASDIELASVNVGGNLHLTAGGTITATSVTTSNDSVTLDNSGAAAGNIAVGEINAGTGTVILNAKEAITDVDDSTGIDITGGSVSLAAATGIGATGANGALEVDADTVAATNSTSGGIFLNAIGTGGVVITADAQTAGDIEIYGTEQEDLTNVQTADGTITVDVTGADLTATTVTAGGANKNVTFTTTNSGNVYVHNVTAAGDTITINSAGAIEEATPVGVAADLTATTLVLTAVTGIGNIDALETTISNLSASNSTSGDIRIDNTGDLNIIAPGVINSAPGGEIVINVASNLNVNSNVTSNNSDITLTASDSINQATGTVIGSTGGNITLLADTDDNGVGGITQNGTASIASGGGNILLNAGVATGGGNILLTKLDAGTGSVYVITYNGSILDNDSGIDDVDILAGADSGLYAGGGVIGWEYNPIDVYVTPGTLYVYASDVAGPNQVSVSINGTAHIDVRDDWGTPPGLIMFNGSVLGEEGITDIEAIYRATTPDLNIKTHELSQYSQWLLETIVDEELAEALDQDNGAKMKKKKWWRYITR